MDFFSNLYNKAKKKLKDWEAPIQRNFSNGLGQIYNNAKSYLGNTERNIGDYFKPAVDFTQKYPSAFDYTQKVITPKIQDYFSQAPKKLSDWGNNPANTPDWMKSVDTGMRKFSNAAEKTPEFHFADRYDYGKLPEVWKGKPVRKLGVDMAQGIMNIPSKFAQGFSGYGKNFNIGTSEGRSNYLSKMGKGAEVGLDVGGLMGGGGTVKALAKEGFQNIAKPALKSLVWKGVKSGVKQGAGYGAGYGVTSGLQGEGTATEKMMQAVKNIPASAAMGAVAGGVIGGVAPVVGHELGNIKRDIKNRANPEYVNQSLSSKLLDQPAGLSIKDISPEAAARRAAYNARQAASAEKAKQLVAKQMENQRQGLKTAEPGFVSPRVVKAPQKPVLEQPPAVLKSPEVLRPTRERISRQLTAVPPNAPVAKTPLPSIEEFVNGKTAETPKPTNPVFSSEDPFKGNPLGEPNGGKPYNAFQERAYNEKGKSIQELKKITTYPRELSGGGYYKNEIEAMGIPEANAKAEFLKLGYPKRVIEQLDLKKAKSLLDNGVKFDKIPEHVFKKFYTSRAPRQYSGEEMKTAVGQAQYLSTERGGNIFKDTFSKWIGERNAAKTIGMESGAKYRDVPKDMAWDIIDNLEHPEESASQGSRAISGMIRKEFDRLHNEASNLGMDVGYWWDYVPHMWKQSAEEVAEAMKGAGRKFQFANARDIPTYREGISMGLTPKYTNPAQILAEYIQSLEKTKANIRFANDLMNKGVIVDASVAMNNPGFSPIIGPGFPKSLSAGIDGEKVVGHYYAPADVANTINRIFSPADNGKPGKIFEVGAKVSGALQDLTLSGGIPKTPINAWTFAQTTKEVLAGRVKSPLVSLFRASSGNASNKFFEANAGQIIKMQKLGIPVDTSWNISNLMDEGFAKNAFIGTEPGVWNGIKSAWHKTVNEPTFKRFMPMLQINFFNDIERKVISAGKSGEEAARIAAKALQNFYGVTSSGKKALKSKIGRDMTGTVFFAPRYRESMINFWVKNIKAFRHPLALENQSNLKFLAGAALLYGVYEYANYALTGRYMHDNPSGKEDKLLIPIGDGKVLGIPFLSSIATMPRMLYRVGKNLAQGDASEAWRDAFQSSVSMGIKPVADVLANSDYFDNEIYEKNGEPKERVKEQLTYLFKQYGLAHPYLKTLASTETGNNLLKKIGLGVINFKPKSGFQMVSESIESPLRFYNQSSIDGSEFYAVQDKVRSTLKASDKLNFDAIHAPSKNPRTGEYTNEPSVWDSATKASVYLAHPNVLKADTQINQELAGKGRAIDPLFTLPVDQQKIVLTYTTLAPDDPQKTRLLKDNPWMTDFQNKRSDFFDTLPESDPDKPQQEIQFPQPSPEVEQLQDQYYAIEDPKLRAQFIADNPSLSDQFAAKDKYNRAIREAKGLPQYDQYPTASPEVEQIIDLYNSLPKNDGPRGGNKTRSLWIQSHPDEWNKMTTFYMQASLYNLGKSAQQAAFQSEGFDQKGLKAIDSLGNYDIAVTTDANGNKIYSLDPGASSNKYGSGGGGGGSSAASKALTLSSAKLTTLKAKGDFKGWMAAAGSQLDMLQNQANNPNLSELQRTRAESKIATLEKQYSTYKEQGGFTKPKAAKVAALPDEKWRYPLVDPEMLKINALIQGTGSKAPIVGRKVLPLIVRRPPAVHRRSVRKKK